MASDNLLFPPTFGLCANFSLPTVGDLKASLSL